MSIIGDIFYYKSKSGGGYDINTASLYLSENDLNNNNISNSVGVIETEKLNPYFFSAKLFYNKNLFFYVYIFNSNYAGISALKSSTNKNFTDISNCIITQTVVPDSDGIIKIQISSSSSSS